MVTYESFEDWFDEPESYGLRSERFFSQLDSISEPLERNRFIERWMQAAYNVGRDYTAHSQ